MNKDNEHNQDSDSRTNTSPEPSPNLEHRCKKALLRIADHVSDINFKLTHFLESYREDARKANYNNDMEYQETTYQPEY